MAAALPEYYHGAMSKVECEELLGKKNKDGAYLIRDSETIQGAMCLCVYKKKVVYTYRLLQTHNGSYTLLTAGGIEETYFKNLDDLIRNYKRKNQGLAIHLRRAVKRKTSMLIQVPTKRSEMSPRNQREASVGDSFRHMSLRDFSPLPDDEEHDYENAACSEYVEVLPDEQL